VLYSTGMQVLTFAPSEALAPFVRVFRIVEAGEETSRLLVPEPGLVLGIRYGGFATMVQGGQTIRLSDTALTGLVSVARRMFTSGGAGIVLAAFRPAGAARFFPGPLDELFDRTVGLDGFVGRPELERVASQVAAAPDHRGRVAALERFLLRRLRSDRDPLIDAAVEAIDRSRGQVRIGALADALGTSQDPLEKRFRRAVGASPKRLASIVRLRHAIDGYRSGMTLSSLAHGAGYFDQSHFVRELRSVTGQSPLRFFRSRTHC
jgi:AraC-like DNA-binding protein